MLLVHIRGGGKCASKRERQVIKRTKIKKIMKRSKASANENAYQKVLVFQYASTIVTTNCHFKDISEKENIQTTLT